MKVLINTSTLNKGGALQAAVSFIMEAMRDRCGIEWHFVVSPEVLDELIYYGVGKDESTVTVFEASPARCTKARRKLKELVESIAPNVVFTIFGPAYVKFQVLHLCGVGNGWVTHSTWRAFRTLGLPRRILRALAGVIYKAYWYRKADHWVTEAEASKKGLVRRLCLPAENITVIPNTYGPQYIDTEEVAAFPKPAQKIRILCLSAYYPHKNLEIIPAVAKALHQVDPTLDFEFIVTLPSSSEGLISILKIADGMGVSHRIYNYGPMPVVDGPTLYRSCHIAFLPSLLETFSANYPEAMATGRPIITTDLDFARDACKQAALYYQPMCAVSAANAVLRLCSNEALWTVLVREGKRVLRELPTPQRKYQQYVQCILSLYESQEYWALNKASNQW